MDGLSIGSGQHEPVYTVGELQFVEVYEQAQRDFK